MGEFRDNFIKVKLDLTLNSVKSRSKYCFINIEDSRDVGAEACDCKSDRLWVHYLSTRGNEILDILTSTRQSAVQSSVTQHTMPLYFFMECNIS